MQNTRKTDPFGAHIPSPVRFTEAWQRNGKEKRERRFEEMKKETDTNRPPQIDGKRYAKSITWQIKTGILVLNRWAVYGSLWKGTHGYYFAN